MEMNDDLDFAIEEKLQELANIVAELIDLRVSKFEVQRQVEATYEMYVPE
jgi:hypothetical protein